MDVLVDGLDADTRFYWKLTRHIFRYGHTDGAVGGTLLPGVHTVNEGEYYLTVYCVATTGYTCSIGYRRDLIPIADKR